MKIDKSPLYRAAGLIGWWVRGRETLNPWRSRTSWDKAFGPFRSESYLPNNRLCWVLTFELILRTLTPTEYRALAAWYRRPDSDRVTAAALSAAHKVNAEAEHRGLA